MAKVSAGEGYAFDFFGAFCLRYDQFWQSTVILAATGSATTVLQMTSMAGMTAADGSHQTEGVDYNFRAQCIAHQDPAIIL